MAFQCKGVSVVNNRRRAHAFPTHPMRVVLGQLGLQIVDIVLVMGSFFFQESG